MLISNPWKPAMPKAHNINKVDYIITISTLQNDFDKLVSHKKKKKKKLYDTCACMYIIIHHHNLGNTNKQNKINRF